MWKKTGLSKEEVENILREYKALPYWENFIKTIFEQLTLTPEKGRFSLRISLAAQHLLNVSEENSERLAELLWVELIEGVILN